MESMAWAQLQPLWCRPVSTRPTPPPPPRPREGRGPSPRAGPRHPRKAAGRGFGVELHVKASIHRALGQPIRAIRRLTGHPWTGSPSNCQALQLAELLCEQEPVPKILSGNSSRSRCRNRKTLRPVSLSRQCEGKDRRGEVAGSPHCRRRTQAGVRERLGARVLVGRCHSRPEVIEVAMVEPTRFGWIATAVTSFPSSGTRPRRATRGRPPRSPSQHPGKVGRHREDGTDTETLW